MDCRVSSPGNDERRGKTQVHNQSTIGAVLAGDQPIFCRRDARFAGSATPANGIRLPVLVLAGLQETDRVSENPG
jgi:hypothetical protein